MTAEIEKWIKRRLLRIPVADRFDLVEGVRLVACIVPQPHDGAIDDVMAELQDELEDLGETQTVTLRAMSSGEACGELVLHAAPEESKAIEVEVIPTPATRGALEQMPLPDDMHPMWTKGTRAPDPFKAVADIMRTGQQTNLALQRLLAETALEGRAQLLENIREQNQQIRALQAEKEAFREERDEIRKAMVAETLAAESIALEEKRKQDAYEMLRDLAAPMLARKLGFPLPVTTVHRVNGIIERLDDETKAKVLASLTPEDIATFGSVLDAHNEKKDEKTPPKEDQH